MAAAEVVNGALTAYALIGVAFAAAFVSAGIQRIDPQARGSGLGFRLIVLPGAAALWPLLLSRWMRGRVEPPAERHPHRQAALKGRRP